MTSLAKALAVKASGRTFTDREGEIFDSVMQIVREMDALQMDTVSAELLEKADRLFDAGLASLL
jgi:hypothetical protein